MRAALFLMAAAVGMAQTPPAGAAQTPPAGAALTTPVGATLTPPAVLELFRVAAESLAEQDTARFFALFDPQMEGLAELRLHVDALVAGEGAASSIRIVSDTGGDQRREVRLNWLLRVGTGAPRRGVLACVVERRGGGWKIVRLAPVDFFER